MRNCRKRNLRKPDENDKFKFAGMNYEKNR